MILKFGTKLDSDELYYVAKTAIYCISVPLFVHFSFSPMEISVTDFSAPIGESALKLYVDLQEGELYCVNKIKMLILINCILFSIFIFSFCHSYKIHMDIFSVFCQRFLTNY